MNDTYRIVAVIDQRMTNGRHIDKTYYVRVEGSCPFCVATGTHLHAVDPRVVALG